MCVAYPGQVLWIDGDFAVVKTEGRTQRASLILVPEATAGDWVVVTAGTVLQLMDPEEAGEIRALLDEVREAEALLDAAPARS